VNADQRDREQQTDRYCVAWKGTAMSDRRRDSRRDGHEKERNTRVQQNLTARELECLRWVSAGKATTDIAVILGISPHTARDYLKSARDKLDCVKSARAAIKAATLGLIDFEKASLDTSAERSCDDM
jgi:DNA-binding CsgD family transcriptional regulator